MKPPAQSGDEPMKSIVLRSFKKAHVFGMFVLAVGLLATPVLMPSVGNAQDARVAKSMAALKGQTTKLGAPKIDGNDAVGGRDAPALYFGSTEQQLFRGRRGCGGSGRGIGRVLTGPALESIKAGNAFYGKAPVLGTPYISGYEPIKDASGAIIGVYFVGYKK